ncbi:hypothetical protein CARUB_v10011381mg [Capsella rubella]|uniref:Uncharacterized protein n=1 Tax=Capsella rubella TaxID=81985 RepID=R0GSS1_9BRAS|nr:hypothetical protein CARUB_v10011381mg [Capsella rubella]
MQVTIFNMGSTVVLIFQASTANSPEDSSNSSDYRFCVKLTRGFKQIFCSFRFCILCYAQLQYEQILKIFEKELVGSRRRTYGSLKKTNNAVVT